MKTIVIPIFDGTISKNILRTSIFRRLKEHPDLRIVIIPPKGKEAAYGEEFSGERVFIESSSLWGEGRWGSFFAGLFLHSIPTTFMKIRQIDWYWNTGKYIHYFGATTLRALGHFKVWQAFLRAVGNFEPIDHHVRAFYEKWHPDVIFATTMIPSLEVSLMRLAKKDGKWVIGMTKSWDNLTSKAFLRIFPDQLIVPNETCVEEAVRIYGFPKERIIPTGIPQYDEYVHPDFLEPREAFFQTLGLNPSKKIILYAPAGDWMSPYDKEVLAKLLEWIRDEKIINTQVLLRLHPTYESKTEELRGDPNLVIERPGQHVGDLRSYEFLDRDVRHLASSIFYADIVINVGSTMTVEASIYDKPCLLIGFDAEHKLTYRHSIARYYDRDHYRPIMRSGGAWLVAGYDEMFQAIRTYMEHPELHRAGRKRIVDDVCYRMDGKACDRITEVLFDGLKVTASV